MMKATATVFGTLVTAGGTAMRNDDVGTPPVVLAPPAADIAATA